MTVEFLLTFFMFRHLRRSLRTSDYLPQWKAILQGGMIASIVLILAEKGIDTIGIFTPWIAYIFLFFIVYLIYRQKEFSHLKSVLVAISPFIAISFLRKTTQIIDVDFYGSWETYFNAGIIFSLIWMLVMLIITSRQNKALAKERKKTQEEERQNIVMAQLKTDLEVQVLERTAELTQQKEQLQHALDELKITQSQLIHSEKMASLGELTAGIAHEIQNPLNFVNNFSDLNKELITELQEAIAQNDTEEVNAILGDLAENETKITHHGKRAEDIVKSMLQHSRTGSGEKELTDINLLADEFLRLSYHGLRAKDQSGSTGRFNADFKIDLDPDLPKINVVPQDIGRVLLNLINNAFQAVKGVDKPLVRVSTKKIPLPPFEKGDSKKGDFGGIEVTVTDNGPGIPNDIKDKIFQPFFTTKTAGEGTGLGLSMSYDIITKGHGGTIEVDSQEGGGTKFIITIPFDQKDQNQQLT
ncbi:MAG: signal transduction histidine kinase [Cyclobacteriaceae bacterium]|jgi:two-component system NtrC family sensor kinase